jgi:tRNA-dihydrouridine synthase 4
MILSDVFRNSELSRNAELTMHESDHPVIVQFAASNAKDAMDAALMTAPYCNGIDINCGCPQPWAIHEGIGSALLKKPELVGDIVRGIKTVTSGIRMSNGSPFPCSIKIRIHEASLDDRSTS